MNCLDEIMKKKLTAEEEKEENKKTIIFMVYCAVVLFFVVRWIIINEISVVQVFIGTSVVIYHWLFFAIIIGGIGWFITELVYKYLEEILVIVGMLLVFSLFVLLLFWMSASQ